MIIITTYYYGKVLIPGEWAISQNKDAKKLCSLIIIGGILESIRNIVLLCVDPEILRVPPQKSPWSSNWFPFLLTVFEIQLLQKELTRISLGASEIRLNKRSIWLLPAALKLFSNQILAIGLVAGRIILIQVTLAGEVEAVNRLGGIPEHLSPRHCSSSSLSSSSGQFGTNV